MAYEDKRAAVPASKPHALTLAERGKLTVTGVEEVLRFDEEEVEMRTVRGDLIVRGTGLHVGRLAIDTGELAVEGSVTEILYAEEPGGRGGLLTRLFG